MNKKMIAMLLSATVMAGHGVYIPVQLQAQEVEGDKEIISSACTLEEHDHMVGDISLLNEDVLLDNEEEMLEKNKKLQALKDVKAYGTNSESTSAFLFLSDLEYVSDMTKVGYGNLEMDRNTSRGTITLKINDRIVPFLKGIGAHASSAVTYDLTGYEDYTHFSTFAGIDSGIGTIGNGATIKVQVSNDGKIWTDLGVSTVQKSNSEAYYFEGEIAGYKYLRLYGDALGNNAADHVVYGFPRLMKKGYSGGEVTLPKTVEEYDAEIKSYGLNTSVESYKDLLYQRTFVDSVGVEVFKQFGAISANAQEVVDWLLNDKQALYYYVTGSRSNSPHQQSLVALADIYANVAEDFNDPIHGDVYKKLAITVATSGAGVDRYNAFKDIYNMSNPNNPNDKTNLVVNRGGQLADSQEYFKTLPVELLRFVVQNGGDSDDIKWVNAKTRNLEPNASADTVDTNPYSHMPYRSGYDYKHPKYYSEENFDMWNAKHKLNAFNIRYGDINYTPSWIYFEEGGVCGAIAEGGVALHTSVGIPSIFVAQYGHAAYLVYTQDANGKGIWTEWNGVGKGIEGSRNAKLPLNWGTDESWSARLNGNYVLLAQQALNDFDTYVRALNLVLLADVYEGDPKSQELIYEKALGIQAYNMDAMLGLITSYKEQGNKTSEDFYQLAVRFGEEIAYFPVPMSDMLNLVRRYVEPVHQFEIDVMIDKHLQKALVADESVSFQSNDCRRAAKHVLGREILNVATFSFDGEQAGQLILSKEYESLGPQMKYSLDGGTTWVEAGASIVQLTPEQIDSITAANDILISFVGADEFVTIDITETPAPSESELYFNDLENQLVGATTHLEYSLDNGATWQDYVSGVDGTRFGAENISVLTRYKASGTSAKSEETVYNFTEDASIAENSYITMDRLNVVGFSSQADDTTYRASHMLDGNVYSTWQTDKGDTEKYITIEVDEPTYMSQIQYVPHVSAGNGTITKANIYVSVDNETWTTVGKNVDWAQDSEVKTYKFDTPVYAKYAKVEAAGAAGNIAGGAMIQLYEDTTQNTDVWFNLKDDKELFIYEGQAYNLESQIATYGNIYNKPISLSDFEIVGEKIDENGNVIAEGAVLDRSGSGQGIEAGPYQVTYTLTVDGTTVAKSVIAKVLGNPDKITELDAEDITYNNAHMDASATGTGLWTGSEEQMFNDAIIMTESAGFTVDITNKPYGYLELSYGVKDSVRDNINYGKNAGIVLKVLADDVVIYESDRLGWYSPYIKPLIEIPAGTKEVKVMNIPVGAGNNHAAAADIKFYEYHYGNPVDTLPEIEVPAGVVLERGSAFDPMVGVTAKDREDGDLTSQVEILGELDTNKSGRYELVYRVTDRGGNVVEKTRSVVVGSSLYMSDIAYTDAKVGYGQVGIDTSPSGQTIRLTGPNGEEIAYEKGLGLHAVSEITYDLTELNAEVFAAYVGVDRAMSNKGSVGFEVWLDGQKVEQTPVQYGGRPQTYIEVDIRGARELKLRVNDGGNGIGSDHGVWADAKLFVLDAKPVINMPETTWVEMGGTFDPMVGVTALDTEDGDLTAVIEVRGEVDTNNSGQYELVYRVVDQDGNSAESIRSVLVGKSTYVSDMNYTHATVGYGKVGIDKAPSGQTIRLTGADGEEIAYEKGLGLHAISEITYDLTGLNAELFTAYVGVDRAMFNKGSVGFEVWLDGQKVEQTPVQYGGRPQTYVEVNVKDARELKLRVNDGGNGIGSDHGVWADAKIHSVNTVDKKPLEAMIDTTLTLVEEAYTTESWRRLQQVLQRANAVVEDFNATQESVDATLVELEQAMQHLVEQEAYMNLEKLLAYADAKNPEDYVAFMWEEFVNVREEAREVFLDPHATQDDIEHITFMLEIEKRALENYVVVDKSKLKATIEKAEALDKNLYTTESWSVLEEALRIAKNVLQAAGSSIDEAHVAKITQRLEDAIVALEEVVRADKSALKERLDYAATLKEEDYQAPHWVSFREELEQAIRVYEDINATQEDVDYMTFSMEIEIKSLLRHTVEMAVDKSKLIAAIQNAELLDQNLYTTESWSVLEEALRIAKNVLQAGGSSIDQAHVDKITKRLEDAVVGLEEVVRTDKSALKERLDYAATLKEEDYQAPHWVSFREELEQAIKVYEDVNATQEDVDYMTFSMEIEIKSLLRHTVEMAVDKSKLVAAIQNAEVLDQNLYTTESWSVLEEALRIAKNVLQAGGSSIDQAHVDKITKTLEDAVANLVVVEEEVVAQEEVEGQEELSEKEQPVEGEI